MFSKFNIRSRLILLVSIFLIALIVVSIVAFIQVREVAADADAIQSNYFVSLVNLDNAYSRMLKLNIAEKNHIIAPSDEVMDELEAEIATLDSEITYYLDQFALTLDAGEETRAFEAFHTAWDSYQVYSSEVITLSRSNNDIVAQELSGSQGAEAFDQVESLVELMADTNVIGAAEAQESADEIAHRVAPMIIIAALALTTVISIIVAWWIINSITKPIDNLLITAQKVSAGDLSQPIIIQREDEIGILAFAFNNVIESINATMEDMNKLTGAANEGQLDVRADISRHQGSYRQIVQGMNEALDTIISPLTVAAEYVNRISQGDLSEQASGNFRGDFDNFIQTINSLIGSLRQLIGQVQENALQVASASNQIYDAADQSAESTQQVATTIQQITEGTAQQTDSITKAINIVEQVSQAIEGVARGAQEQATSVGQSVELTASLSSTTQQVAANAQTGAAGAARAADTARTGSETVRKTLVGMENIRQKVDLSAEKVREMGQRSEHIGAIVETIDGIASQTNLLALNATIEAARAGEHGKGFAVVADEVRKLAEKATDATQEIGGLIKDIQQTIGEAMQAMDEGAAEVETGVLQAQESGQVLEDILVSSESVSHQMGEIAAAAQEMSGAVSDMVSAMDTVSAIVEENTASTEEMAASADEVSQAFENIASITEENSAATEEVSATTEEVTAQAREVSSSAQTLNEMAQELQETVAQFKLHKNGNDFELSRVSQPVEDDRVEVDNEYSSNGRL
jgi:methyl-accepting chemotaxis protein